MVTIEENTTQNIDNYSEYIVQQSTGEPNGTDLIDYKAIQTTFCILYTIIFVVGVFGNTLVCYVVVRNKAMQTVTNLFITNLALSDILLCLLAVPFTPLYTFLGKWIFGEPLCHIMPYAQGCSVYISTLTLTSIAIDRFFVIIYPFKPRMKISTCIGIVVAIWMFSLLVTFPYGFYMVLDKGLYCDERWPSEALRKTFGALTTCMQFVLPFLIIAFCYTCVSIKLNDRMKTRPGSSRREDVERERKKKMNRMLISMVAIFGISWLPLNLINIFCDFYTPTVEWNYYMVSFFLSHALAMSSTCYNPILYAWLNENFRKEFKLILPCFVSGTRSTTRKNYYRSERSCNGNDTIQESLVTSTINHLPSIKYRIDDDVCVYHEDDEKVEMNMYLYVDQAILPSEKEPIVSAL